MRKPMLLRKRMLGLTVVIAGGALFGQTCINTAASLPICGGILPFCTPGDQINALYPLLETPDYAADPSCTIPYACGDSDLFPGIPGGPSGDASEQPSDNESGGAAGGGG